MKKETSLNGIFYIRRYENESGNMVWDGNVHDSTGKFICKFTLNMAKNYHRLCKKKEFKE